MSREQTMRKRSTPAVLRSTLVGIAAALALSALALTFATLSAGASSSSPDYSKEALLEVFSDDRREKPQPYKNVGPGYVQFRALGSDFRLFFLPIMAPLAGTVSSNGSATFPDPFEHLQTVFPSRNPPAMGSPKDSSWRERLYARKMRKATLKANQQ